MHEIAIEATAPGRPDGGVIVRSRLLPLLPRRLPRRGCGLRVRQLSRHTGANRPSMPAQQTSHAMPMAGGTFGSSPMLTPASTAYCKARAIKYVRGSTKDSRRVLLVVLWSQYTRAKTHLQGSQICNRVKGNLQERGCT